MCYETLCTSSISRLYFVMYIFGIALSQRRSANYKALDIHEYRIFNVHLICCRFPQPGLLVAIGLFSRACFVKKVPAVVDGITTQMASNWIQTHGLSDHWWRKRCLIISQGQRRANANTQRLIFLPGKFTR